MLLFIQQLKLGGFVMLFILFLSFLTLAFFYIPIIRMQVVGLNLVKTFLWLKQNLKSNKGQGQPLCNLQTSDQLSHPYYLLRREQKRFIHSH